jgi:hypothetical protein
VWWCLFCHQNIIGAKFDPPKKKNKKSQTTGHLSRFSLWLKLLCWHLGMATSLCQKTRKKKKKWQQTPLVSSSGCFFDFLTGGLRNQRTGSEEPLVSVISQAQRTCSVSWKSQQRTADFGVRSSFIIPPYCKPVALAQM